MPPLYLENLTLPELRQKAEALTDLLKECKICPQGCLANRAGGEVGVCHSGDQVYISSYGPHFGEEPPLVGNNGSGTIFFAHCNLRCVYCQNFEISRLGEGFPISTLNLAKIMLELQNKGCSNINLVSPTHYTPQIVSALLLAIDKNLQLPLVYNCGGYESVETLKILENVIDIYMPDIKYSNNENGQKYSGVPDYWDRAREAIREMHRQVGDLIIGRGGYAQRGALIRHLVLPEDIAGSKRVIDFIADELSRDSYLNIMDQYFPYYKAKNFKELNRRVSQSEYRSIVDYALSKGITRGIK